MIAFAWILLLATPASVELVDEVYRIPAQEWRYIELGLKQRPGRVSARFDAQPGSPRVRLALMQRDDLELLRNRKPHEVMSATAAAGSGILNFEVSRSGDYVLVIENQSGEAASVHLRVWLHFPRVTKLSPQRQLTVIAISFAFFCGVVTFSARRLLRAIKR